MIESFAADEWRAVEDHLSIANWVLQCRTGNKKEEGPSPAGEAPAGPPDKGEEKQEYTSIEDAPYNVWKIFAIRSSLFYSRFRNVESVAFIDARHGNRFTLNNMEANAVQLSKSLFSQRMDLQKNSHKAYSILQFASG